MRLVFVSNFFNHHQHFLSDAFYRLTDGSYCFIAYGTMDEERVRLGWNNADAPDYVRSYSADPNAADSLILDADTVIFGSVPNQLLRARIKAGKQTFRYSERLFKKGSGSFRWLYHLFQFRRDNPTRQPLYLLCASAYAAKDYASFGLFRNKAYCWGYFPETRRYENMETLFEAKDPKKILWCGRFIDWKHPDDVVRLAERLKHAGLSFHLDMIGTGYMEESIQSMIANRGLQDCVSMLGAMAPSEVRRHMEEAGIYVYTSDFQEGWGAVLNESMNSGCAVVASHAIGSVPYLLQNGENGFIYKSGDLDGMEALVSQLLKHPEMQRPLGEKACQTISLTWNAETAAERFLKLASDLAASGISTRYASGPCCPAVKLENTWFHS